VQQTTVFEAISEIIDTTSYSGQEAEECEKEQQLHNANNSNQQTGSSSTEKQSSDAKSENSPAKKSLEKSNKKTKKKDAKDKKKDKVCI
jgi:hypothetical protein